MFRILINYNMQRMGIGECRRKGIPGSHPYGCRGYPLVHNHIIHPCFALDPGLRNLRLGRQHSGIVLIHEQSPVEDHAEGKNEE